jgi:dTDP-4-amino-4,6-dideoxy-D-galactose acyltransferase
MIKELLWDSTLFKKKIGEFVLVSQKPSYLKEVLNKAKENRFDYITCKMRVQNTSLNRLLESSGFYLTDIGVTLATKTDIFFHGNLKNLTVTKTVRPVETQDISALKRMSKSLFIESRFYSDPFFSRAMAERLYQVWVENSVNGQAADITYWIPQAGFITCRKSGKNSGSIILIGIKKGLRGKGFGTALVNETMEWFRSQKISLVTVRTQLKNIDALNFYIKTGFFVKEYDMIFGKIL